MYPQLSPFPNDYNAARPAGPRPGRRLLSGALALGLGLCSTALAGQATLNWTDNSSNEVGFNIERSVESGAWEAIAQVSANVTTYADETVQANVNYAYRVNAFNAAGVSGYTNTATFLLADTLPTISAIGDVVGPANAAVGPIAFEVSDSETSAGALGVTVISSDNSIIDADGIALGGSGASRTLTLYPEMDASGSVTISVKVFDGVNEVTKTFAVTINEQVIPDFSIAGITRNWEGLVPNGQSATVQVSTNLPGLIDRVDYMVGDTVVATSNAAPFSASVVFNSSGTYDLVAKASLVNSLLTTSDTLSITVAPEPIDSTLVSSFKSSSVGTLPNGGSVTYVAGEDAFQLSANGGLISGGSDSLQSSMVQVKGDATISARLNPLANASGPAVAGIMLRGSKEADANQIGVVVNEAGEARLVYRSATGATLQSQVLAADIGDGKFAKIERSAETVRIYLSDDGVVWQSAAEKTIQFGTVYLAGLVMADQQGGAVALIDRLSLSGSIIDWNETNLPPAAPRALLIGGL